MKRGRVGCGELLWPLYQLSLQLFICLQTCTLSKSRHPMQQNKLVHTSGMYPSSTVHNVIQKELLHIGGVHSCRVGSLFRPWGKSFHPIISCRETMWRENALTEKKSQLFIWSKLAFNYLMSLDKSLQARLQFYNHEWNCSASFDLRASLLSLHKEEIRVMKSKLVCRIRTNCK